jgi:general secretion pathway protein L
VLGFAQASGSRVKIGKGRKPSNEQIRTAARIVAVVPGQDVIGHRVSLPVKSDIQARKAVPFALEEKLAQPVGEIHLALATPSGEGERDVLLVDRDRMRQWLSVLSDIGITPDALIPDQLLYAHAADGDGLIEHASGVTMIHRGRGVSVDRPLAGLLAEQVFDAGPDAHALVSADDLVSLARARGWSMRAAPELEEDWALLATGALAVKNDINLLQGDFEARPGWFSDLGFWRFAAALWVLAGLLYAALLFGQTTTLNQRSAENRAAAEQVVRDTLPNVTRIVDPRRQMQAALQGAGGGASSDLIAMSALATQALQNAPGVAVNSLRFDSSARAMVLGITYQDYPAVTSMRQFLEANGVAVNEGAARQSGAGMVGEVTLTWR